MTIAFDPAYNRAVREAYCAHCDAVPSRPCRNRYGGVQWPPHAPRIAFVIMLDVEIARLQSSASLSPGAEGDGCPPSMVPSGAPLSPEGASGGPTS